MLSWLCPWIIWFLFGSCPSLNMLFFMPTSIDFIPFLLGRARPIAKQLVDWNRLKTEFRDRSTSSIAASNAKLIPFLNSLSCLFSKSRIMMNSIKSAVFKVDWLEKIWCCISIPRSLWGILANLWNVVRSKHTVKAGYILSWLECKSCNWIWIESSFKIKIYIGKILSAIAISTPQALKRQLTVAICI